jgi:hypothetical protein
LPAWEEGQVHGASGAGHDVGSVDLPQGTQAQPSEDHDEEEKVSESGKNWKELLMSLIDLHRKMNRECSEGVEVKVEVDKVAL